MSRLLLKVTDCSIPVTKPKTFRLAISPPLPVHASENNNIITVFNINDYVKNKDNLYGIINLKTDDYIIVNWSDNTRERINTHLLEDDYLKKITESEYKENVIEKLPKPDVEKLKLEKQVKTLEAKLNNGKINQVKEKTAQEIIDLAIMKGLLDENDSDMEMVRILAMSDEEFEHYQQNILDTPALNGDVYSAEELKQEDYAGLSKQEIEAKQELAKLRMAGKVASPISNNINTGESRSLSDVKFDYSNNQLPETMEESLLKAMNALDSNNDTWIDPFENSSFENNISENNNSQNINQNKSINASFLNIPFEGPTKPLSLGANSPGMITPATSNFDALFSQLDWTMPGQRK